MFCISQLGSIKNLSFLWSVLPNSQVFLYSTVYDYCKKVGLVFLAKRKLGVNTHFQE